QPDFAAMDAALYSLLAAQPGQPGAGPDALALAGSGSPGAAGLFLNRVVLHPATGHSDRSNNLVLHGPAVPELARTGLYFRESRRDRPGLAGPDQSLTDQYAWSGQ